MTIPQVRCSKCDREFELFPNKPGLINVCPSCTLPAEALLRKVEQDAKLKQAMATARRAFSRSFKLQPQKKQIEQLKIQRQLQEMLVQNGFDDEQQWRDVLKDAAGFKDADIDEMIPQLLALRRK